MPNMQLQQIPQIIRNSAFHLPLDLLHLRRVLIVDIDIAEAGVNLKLCSCQLLQNWKELVPQDTHSLTVGKIHYSDPLSLVFG